MRIVRRFSIAEGLAVFVLLARPAMSRAQTASPSPVAPSPSSSSGASAAKRPRVHFFVGEVAAVMPADQKFSVRETLRDGSPKVTLFTAVAETVVSRGKDRAVLADLRVNDHVTIKYTENAGERRALSIRITPSVKSKTPPAK